MYLSDVQISISRLTLLYLRLDLETFYVYIHDLFVTGWFVTRFYAELTISAVGGATSTIIEMLHL